MRAQDTLQRWGFDRSGGIQAYIQLAPPDFQIRVIPIQKALLFRTTTKRNNPEGRSILRNSYRPWYFKRRIEEIEGVGIERDLAGLPIAFVPSDYLSKTANADQRATVEGMRQLVTNVRRDEQEGIVFPRAYDANNNLMYDFKLLASEGNRQFDTDKVLLRKANEILDTVLAGFISLGNEIVGSYALSVSKTGMFQAALSAWLDVIAEIFNRYALPRLFELNGFDTDQMPTLIHDDVAEPSLEELSALITALAGAGYNLAGNLELMNTILRIAKLPEYEPTADGVLDDTRENENGEQVRVEPSTVNTAPVTVTATVTPNVPSPTQSITPANTPGPAPGGPGGRSGS
jgi:hypothetical protein